MAASDPTTASPSPNHNAEVGAPKPQALSRPELSKSESSFHGANGPRYLQSSGNRVVVIRRRRRKDVGAWKQLARWLVENQIGLAFNLLALLFLSHKLIPKARPYTQKFFQFGYYNSQTGKYGAGFDDFYVIAFCIVLFTGLRAATMEYVLAPIARYGGCSKPKDVTRFSEQAWLLTYYLVFWPLGVYIWYHSSFYMNLEGLWTNWPDRELTGLIKGYMLAQWAFWLQQILVINIEERRKDHWQMFSHHIITTALISACYSYHFTRIGTLILVIMDVVDLFLPVAKCLKYTGFTTLCDVAFGLFMLSWLIARHVIYVMVCWSIHADATRIIGNNCYSGTNENLVGPFETPSGLSYLAEPFYKSDGIVCWNRTVKWAFLAPLSLLQGITIVWFTMIIRVAIKVLRGDGAEDSRSDDECVEDEEEEEEEVVYEEAQPIEEDVGVEAINLKSWERRTGVKRQASSSGVTLPGHSDRKELLGRIGCEKQVD